MAASHLHAQTIPESPIPGLRVSGVGRAVSKSRTLPPRSVSVALCTAPQAQSRHFVLRLAHRRQAPVSRYHRVVLSNLHRSEPRLCVSPT